MNLTLNENWRVIVRKAWSLKFMALAGIFSTAEAVLPLYSDQFPRGLFASLTAASILGGMGARLFIQKGIDGK